jgi:hypothetical protein
MQRALALAVVLMATPLVGCIGTDSDVDQASTTPDTDTGTELTDVTTDTPLKAPHPDYDYPTFTDPTNGVEGEVPDYWEPPAPGPLPSSAEQIEHLANDEVDEERGAGIAIFGSLAIVPSFINTTTIYDISDPENPERLSELAEPPARDADTIAFPDGRLFAVFATDNGVVPVFNITNPEDPKKVTTIEPERGSHNVGVVPGTPLLYNSASLGGGEGSQVPGQGQEGTAIYDLSDPKNPKLVQDFQNGYSCHDISFLINESEEKYRAYCAGIQMTQIWNIEDPKNPEVIVNVPAHHGVSDTPSTGVSSVLFSHLAMTNEDGTVLIVGDENGGGLAPACDAHVEAGGQSASGPSGNLWFYDISDEENPQLMGWLSPSQHYADNPPQDDRFTPIGGVEVPAGCTAHFGQLVPGEEKLVMGFYGAGVLLIDFSDPANPMIVDRFNDNTNVWDAWVYQGYVITGDLARGMDVYELQGPPN